MGIYRGAGGSGDAVNDASSEALITIQARDAALAAQAAAEAAQTAAELAETNAETAETNAETAETNAETAATNAAASASAASTSASNAASSASAASTSASNASTSATNAASSASAASTSASNASTSATNASNSASSASTSATNASNSASAAASSATTASNAATAAQTAQTAAELAETNAETAETNAETAETNAAASASAASTSASNAASSASAASTSASNAATSATNASNSASSASTSATNASNSASAAATSASNAATSASNAATSATNAAASYDSFDDRYLGAKSSAPTLDNDGNALLTGALYFNSTSNEMKVWSGSAWLNAYASLSGALLATNNLSDLNNTATARTNLGVAIGTDVQAYDADTAKLDVAQSWSAAQSFNAGVTLGDASGDALTINSSAVSIPNGLNFDSDTFVIDATNNRVGIGTSSPASALQVLKASANPTLNITRTTSSATTIGDALYLRLNDTTGTSGMRNEIGMGYGIPATTTYTPSLIGYVQTSSSGSTFGDLYFATRSVTTDTAPSERMRIASSGNVVIGATDAQSRLTVNDASSSSTTVGTNPVIWIGGGNGSVNTNSEIGFTYGAASWAETYAPATIGYQLKSGSGYTYGDITFCTRSVITDTAPTERMRITSTGNVGIGTSSPAERLDIASGNFKTTGFYFAATGGRFRMYNSLNSNFSEIYNPETGSGASIAFRYGGGEAMRIDSSGNVGIGTSTPAYRLEANSGSTDATALFDSTSVNGSHIRIASSGTVKNYIGCAAGFVTSGSADDLGLRAVGKISFATNGAAADMTLDASGNLGIGTSSPANKLDVSGAVRTGSESSVGLYLGASALRQSTTGGLYIDANSTGAAGGIYFRDSSSFTTRLTIDSSGNVGIGTSSPGYRLDVQSSTATTVNVRIKNTNATAKSGIQFDNQVSTGSGSVYYDNTNAAFVLGGDVGVPTVFNSGGTERMRIDSSGFVAIGNTVAATIDGQNGSGNLVVGSGSGNEGITVYTATNGNGTLAFADGTSAGDTYRGYLQYEHANNALAIGTNAIERMRITSGGDLQFNSGYGSVATAYGCRAWVNFNGTSTVAIRSSGNVSSITDNGTGNYTVNFTNALTDANYCAQVTGGDSSTGAGGQTSSVYSEAYTTTTFQVRTMGVASGSSTTQSARDFNFVNVAVFR